MCLGPIYLAQHDLGVKNRWYCSVTTTDDESSFFVIITTTVIVVAVVVAVISFPSIAIGRVISWILCTH